MRAAVDDDPARVHALPEPQFGQRLPEAVGADGGEIGGVRAEPGGGDHGVRRVAAEALEEGAPSFGWLSSTSGSPIARRSDTAHLVATATATPAITPPAARWTRRIALVERKKARARLAASA